MFFLNFSIMPQFRVFNCKRTITIYDNTIRMFSHRGDETVNNTFPSVATHKPTCGCSLFGTTIVRLLQSSFQLPLMKVNAQMYL